MGETCRECRPLYEEIDFEALSAGIRPKYIGVELCPKHSEVDELRKQLEEARLQNEIAIAHATCNDCDGPDTDPSCICGGSGLANMAQSALQAEVERLRNEFLAYLANPEAFNEELLIVRLKDALARRG